MIQRSIVTSESAAPSTTWKFAAFAYKLKKETVFQYVSRVFLTTSESASCPTRRALHGEPAANMYQRTASAPC